MNHSRNFAYRKPGLFLARGTIVPIAVVSILTSNPCLGQITPDTTLGNQNSLVMTGVNIKDNEADLIEGGVQRGSNLYHSFLEFNVNNGQRVYFANPTGVDNILSRVTGSSPSNILGTLGVNGAANLFLLNPKGIIFGTNAQLDIQGSFLATTDDSFKFPDGSEFSATNPQAPPLLTMSVPVGVQFGLQQMADITSEGHLVTGKDLTLNAGNLDLQGTVQAGGNLTLQAQNNLKVRDSATNPFIAAAGGNLLAQGNKVDIYALNHPDSGFFSGGDMVLQSENTIRGDAHFWAGGNFRIEKLNGDLGNLFSPDDPVIRANGDVSFDSYTGASLHILAGGSVNISGNVRITDIDSTNSLQETITLSDGTPVKIDGSTTPTLDIRAGVDANYIGIPSFTPNLSIGFNPQNPITTNTPTNANINIKGSIYNLSGFESNSGKILITNQYHPNGLAGDITTGLISTFGDVAVDSRGNITTNRMIDTTTANNNGGNIILIANESLTTHGQLLSATTWGKGNGGNISLLSRHGEVNTKGGDIISRTTDDNDGEGIGGDVTIEAAGNIYVANIEASSFQNNNSSDGNVNPKYYSNIQITSNNGSVYLNNSKLDTTNKGSSLAGNIIINASDKVSILKNSEISSKGYLGFIFIGYNSQPKTFIIDNSKITTNSNNSEKAGYIEINARDQVSILDNSKISSQGNIGYISIGGSSQLQTIIIDDSEINTNNAGSGDAGSISINAASISLRHEAKITASTQGSGKAGTITLGSPEKPSQQILISGDKTGLLAETQDYNDESLNNQNEKDDAGESLDNAQQFNTENFNQISGKLANGNDVDLYLIDIKDPKNFSATTANSEVSDTRLFLFDSNGYGVYANDDIDFLNFYSALPINDPLGPSTPGNYYLAVSGYGVRPINETGEIFDMSSYVGTSKPTLTGSSSPLQEWEGTSYNFGNYTIKLTGVGNNQPMIKPGGTGGDITIYAVTLDVKDEASISAVTIGSGNAGNITIDAKNTLSLQGEALISSAARGTARGNAGTVKITSPNIDLRDNAKIDTQTANGNGGDIEIITGNLLLRNNSKITATAGSTTNPGNGGSITINAKDGFVVAVPSENSDIIANAFRGKGGRIKITANRILGFQNRKKLSSEQLKAIENNRISDISASSDVGENGEVSLNTLSIDPTQGLVQLPTNLVDTSKLIAQGCGSNSSVAKGRSEFVITGRGGLPPSPDDTLKPGAISPEWVVNNAVSNSNNSVNMPETNLKQLSSNTADTLVEAVGMVRSANGDIVLTAQPTTATGLQSGLSSQVCSVVQGSVKQ